MRKRSASPAVDPSDAERVPELDWSVLSSEPCEIRERADITFIIDPLDALVRVEGGELRKRKDAQQNPHRRGGRDSGSACLRPNHEA